MGDRVERLLDVHKAQRLLVLACLVHQYSEIRDLISCPPCLVGILPVHLQFPFRSLLFVHCPGIINTSLYMYSNVTSYLGADVRPTHVTEVPNRQLGALA